MKKVKTTCAYCGVGCGISATVTGGRNVTIAGDKDHPANFGKHLRHIIDTAQRQAGDNRVKVRCPERQPLTCPGTDTTGTGLSANRAAARRFMPSEGSTTVSRVTFRGS